jgi:hypothetical protein
VEIAVWKSFKNVRTNFLGNYKAENYRDMVADLVQSYKPMGCNMSLKVHFLDSHLDFFPQNLRAVGDEYRELFHQDISTMGKQSQDTWSRNMLSMTFHRQNIAEVHPLLYFLGNVYTPCNII